MSGNAKALKLDRDLREAAKLIGDVGWSRWDPIGDSGTVSLPGALGLICGVPVLHVTSGIEWMLPHVPGEYVERLGIMWSILETRLGQDLAVANRNYVYGWQVVELLETVANLIETD
jgi:hypothetical protein